MSRSAIKWPTALAAVVAFVALSGCGGSSSSDTSSESGSPATSGKPTGEVVVAYPAFQSESFLPNKQNISARPYYGAIFDPLVGVSADGKVDYAKGLLDSLESNANGKQYTLKLKSALEWQNGDPITAEDVKFTLELMAKDPGSSVTGLALKSELAGVEVKDDLTAVVRLKAPDVIFPTLLSPLEGDLGLYPKKYYESVGAKGFEEKPVGSGPWKFASRTLGQEVTFTANESYWDKTRVPGFETLRIVLAPDKASRGSMLRSGEADLSPVDPSDVPSFSDGDFEVMGPANTASLVVTLFRQWDPSFITNKLEFRKALALSIDTQAIAKAFYPEGTAEVAKGSPLFSPIVDGYDSSLAAYPYDPEQAKSLLQQSGYDGRPVTLYSFTFPGVSEIPDLDTAIADYWKKIGIDVKLETVEFGSFVELATSQKFDGPAAIAVTPAQPRPSMVGNIRTYMVSKDDGGLFSAYPDLDAVGKAYSDVVTIADADERTARLKQLGGEWYEQYWAVPLVWRNGPWIVGPKIGGWEPSDGTSTWLAFETLRPAG